MLLADALAHAVRFTIDSATGRLVFPTEGSIDQAEELVLFVPRESPMDDHELQLLLSTGEASEAAADRWRAYHGNPKTRTFGAFGIEDVKFDGQVVEQAITGPNPLAAIEGRLCRSLNAARAGVAAACRRIAGVDVQEPLVVGVDAFGVDVKARFGIVRLEFDEYAADEASATRAIAQLLGGAP